jgi:tetratricopeptide (TPR) repeat protein
VDPKYLLILGGILAFVGPLHGQQDSGQRTPRGTALTQISSALNRQEYSLVLSLCSKALPTLSDSRQRALILTYRAAAYRHLGQLEKAKTDDEAALSLNPRTPFAHAGLAGVHDERREIDQSIAEYSAEIALNPKYLPAYTNRGHWYRKRREFDKAIGDFNTAVRLYPNDPAAFVELAVLYYIKGEPEKVGAYLHQASAKVRWSSAEDEGAMRLLGWFQSTCPDARFRKGAEAVKWAKRSCELTHWKDYGSMDGLAAAYAEYGDFEQAIKFELQALRVNQISKSDRLKMEKRLSGFKEHKPYRDNFAET